MTLRWGIALMLAAIALTVSASSGVVAYLGTERQLNSVIDDTLKSRAAAVNTASSGRGHGPGGGAGSPGGGPNNNSVGGTTGGTLDAADCPDAGSFQPAAAAQLVAANGTVIGCIAGGPQLPTSQADRSTSSGTNTLETVTINGQRYRLLSTTWYQGGTLQIARSLAESDSLLQRLRWQLLVLIVAATVVPALLGWLIATRLTRPISSLRKRAEHIASTLDLSEPVEVGGTGEVGSLAMSFATMVSALARSQEQQRRLVSDASHEMRTPLTSLRSNTELLARIEELDPAERREVTADVLNDIDELSGLLGELVELASDTVESEPRDVVSLAGIATSAAARAQRRTDRHVSVRLDEAADVYANSRQLERAVSNLIDNALKYSSRGDVEVVVRGASVSVQDRGRGIPATDLVRVFDRFYRAVQARSEPGSGLGLSIVAAIVGSHGGTVSAANRPDGGASVGFTLPPVIQT